MPQTLRRTSGPSSSGRRRGWLRRAIAPVLVMALVTGCAEQIAGNGSQSQTRSGGNTDFEIIGDADTAYDELAKKAMVDTYAFWEETYPAISGGDPFEPLAGGVYSVDGGNPSDEALEEACLERVPDVVEDNLLHCRLDDSIAYDRTSGFFNDLIDETGEFTLAAIFAHEMGHAVQYRLQTRPASTVYNETQADCFAGAWIGWILDGNGENFRISDEELDLSLTGYIQLRDPDGSAADEPGAHGNGFDRVAALADGIAYGASFCLVDWNDRGITQRPYTDPADYDAGGDLPYDGDRNGSDTITLGPEDLEAFWVDAFDASGRTWEPVELVKGRPSCDSEDIARIGYCSDDNAVQYENGILEDAYEYGDFAAMTMLGIGWGLSVRAQLGRETTDGEALLAAACYQGAYAAARNVEPAQSTGIITLSPSDMDEGTIALLTLVPDDDAYGSRGTTGYQRVQYFIEGYFGGLPAC
jgi:predicted metalloprotease